jgi:preprotein translocase subunit SecG
LQVAEPRLDQRPDRVLETCLARDGQRLLVRRAHLLDRDPLLEPVVARHEELLDTHARVLVRHRESVKGGATLPRAMPWVSISAVVQVLLSAFLVTLVLMHSGREAGMGGLGFTPHSQGGTHIVERNLTRLTIVVAVVFGLNTVALFHLL